MFGRTIKHVLNALSNRFDKTGERVDITYTEHTDFWKLNMYEKSHFRRYEFAVGLLQPGMECGDFACGTGYGSVMLSKKASKVTGVDINEQVITGIRKRYESIPNVTFIHANLLEINFKGAFDAIVSFETIEHLPEDKLPELFGKYGTALKPEGMLIFSTPYLQERSPAAIKLGHHLTFGIDEAKISRWLASSGFRILEYQYQNYQTHDIKADLPEKDFVICIAKRI